MWRVNLVVLVSSLCGLIFFGYVNSFISAASTLEFEFTAESTGTYTYDRLDEVKKQCASVLNSAVELKPEDSRFYSIKEELVFSYGDWWQEAGSAPILPFNDREVINYPSEMPLNLASFWVTDVDRAHQSKKFVSVSGILLLGITVDNSFMEKPYGGSPQFQIWSGHTQLTIFFQGIYTETKQNGGERVMCLLGNTMLPSRESDSSDPWEWVKASDNQSPLLQDDQILLVVRYPKTFTLTSRAIRGELRSLNPKSNLKYFDKVHISSQLGKLSRYVFERERFVSRACNPYPYRDSLMNGDIDIYKGVAICEILEQVSSGGALTVSPNGQLCMIGCLGLIDSEESSCISRACLYIPVSFSIKQRSIIVGSFFSIEKNNMTFFPLSFEKLVQPTELWNYFRTSHPRYSYSKTEAAGTILERNEAFSFGTVIKKSFLHYPKLEDADDFLSSLSLLSEDLTLHSSAFPDPMTFTHSERTEIQVEILSLGSLFGRYWSLRNISTIDEETSYHAKTEYTEKQLLLNVSAQLMLSGDDYSNFSVLFLEGLYDMQVGKMYLVGCRDVRAAWKILLESIDLEAGLDCLIEVIVAYPPLPAQWLVNPTARISITSQRNEDDPLYFSTIKLQTLPILYRKQREDILSRRGIEGILRILTLSFAIACISSQLFYMKHDSDSVSFISLVMLGVQALGYSIPLITGAEALFKRKAHESYEMTSYDLQKNQWFYIIDYAVKLLVLMAFLLTLRLFQKVWKSRIRLLTRTPLEAHRVPSDRRILLTTLIIHVSGFIIVLIVHSVKTSQRPLPTSERYLNSMGSGWETELEEYIGLVQDFFLLDEYKTDRNQLKTTENGQSEVNRYRGR
ncbi:LOW QUALITY PROTEIN: uncharacterized protein LOC110821156 [Carica papaya]|uniref:LOW QUALITY PROTEIN: uncharacterized protein LOC110821156 n=1 Tax=Carica papaya TaxID=3649 RepID=UPI000B8CC526|nr:LOW QUALITY PROTEIN: uncharacterized protein LOC110821156 [Carica papaya]